MKNIFLCLLVLSFGLIASAKRAPPKPVKAVSYAGLKFEAVDAPESEPAGGYVRVLIAKDSIPICTRQIYVTEYVDKLERDVQDNFITRLTIKDKKLIVESEKLKAIEVPLENFCE